MRLRQRANLYGMIDQADGRGGWHRIPGLIEQNVWMSIIPLSARDIERYQTVYPEVDTRIVLRYREDLDDDCWIIHRSRKYEVLGLPINASGENRIIEIMAVKRGRDSGEPDPYHAD